MAQNDFLQFDENNENVLTQDAYREDEQRISGAKSGVARSSLFNKVLRQVSTFVAGFGQFISEKNINVLEDIDSVKNALTNLFTAKNVGVSTEVQTLLGVNNVDDCLYKASLSDGIASYLAFVGNVNNNMVDAAYGKNNEDADIGLGKALVLDARNRGGADKAEYPFTNLMKVKNVNDLNSGAAIEIKNNTWLYNILSNNAYAKEKIISYVDIVDIFQSIGCAIDHSSVSEYMNDTNCLSYLNSASALEIALSNSLFCKQLLSYRTSYDYFRNIIKNADNEKYTAISNNASIITANATFETLYSFSSGNTNSISGTYTVKEGDEKLILGKLYPSGSVYSSGTNTRSVSNCDKSSHSISVTGDLFEPFYFIDTVSYGNSLSLNATTNFGKAYTSLTLQNIVRPEV